MSVEHLLSMLSPQSVNPARLIEGSRSTSPGRTTADDVRAALAALPPLYRGALLLAAHGSEIATSDAERLALALRAEISLRALRSNWTRAPKHLDAIIRVVVCEFAAPGRICRVCGGAGVIQASVAGKPVVCDHCDGSGRARWSARRRARLAKIPPATWACRVDVPYQWTLRAMEVAEKEAARALGIACREVCL